MFDTPCLSPAQSSKLMLQEPLLHCHEHQDKAFSNHDEDAIESGLIAAMDHCVSDNTPKRSIALTPPTRLHTMDDTADHDHRIAALLPIFAETTTTMEIISDSQTCPITTTTENRVPVHQLFPTISVATHPADMSSCAMSTISGVSSPSNTPRSHRAPSEYAEHATLQADEIASLSLLSMRYRNKKLWLKYRQCQAEGPRIPTHPLMEEDENES